LYSAYEGDDLDNEFPTILQERWNQINGIFNEQRQQTIERNQRSPFPLPGRGGSGTPSKALPKFRGDETAREMADTLWEELHAGVRT
jgi:hypothetical protein